MNRTDIPKLYQKLYEQAANGKASPRKAIKAFCLDCVGYGRDEITHCTDTGCSLYCYRPYRGRSRRAPESCQTPDFEGVLTVESPNAEQRVVR